MPFKVFTMNEAASEARITRRMLEKQPKAGTGPAVTRIGTRVLVRSDELEAWLQRCTVAPGSAALIGRGARYVFSDK